MKPCPVANHEMYTICPTGKVHSGKSDITITPRVNTNGYLIVVLDKVQLSLHRLVAQHFIPNPYGHPQVNHKDGDKTNNHVANLEWCSAEQNIQHALHTGLRKGFIHVNKKREYLQQVLNGVTVASIAETLDKTHPNTLNKMLRDQAIKDGLLEEWTKEAKRKRRGVALRNLETMNVKNS